MVAHGFSEELQQQMVQAYGNRSFLSGEELA
jgi:hypothetical protein